MHRQLQIKNRAPAPIQITAEQILREARDRGLEEAPKPPKQFITDKDELNAHQLKKRKEFEDGVQRNRKNMSKWVLYGQWEAEQKEFERARSVFERALDVDYRSEYLWTNYAEMEMKNKFINHARNIWNRCVTLHPRNDSFWLKYTYMEELAGSVDSARQVFERYMAWEPNDNGWAAYIKFEQRQGEPGRVRALFERYVACHPTCRAFLKYAKWEEACRQLANTRAVYEQAVEKLHSSERTLELVVAFARFEERCKEVDRARAIFQYAKTHVASDAESAERMNEELVAFEKRHGERDEIEDAILSKRRTAYETAVASNKYDYDSWFDYVRLEEGAYRELCEVAASSAAPALEEVDLVSAFAASSSSSSSSSSLSAAKAVQQSLTRTREVYERAIACVPLSSEKRFWRHYVYLWINYALFEELDAKELPRARAVYAACLATIPHKKFTFSKIWLQAACLEVRSKDLGAARKLLGQALGLCSQFSHNKPSIFRGYLALELQLGEVDRCRSIYAKSLELMPANCKAWCDYAALESRVGESARSRAIYEIAISQAQLDTPEALWKAYIDFEAAEGEVEHVRRLYERLLQRASHVKVWTAYALFEASLEGRPAAVAAAAEAEAKEGVAAAPQPGTHLERAQQIFQQAYAALKATVPASSNGGTGGGNGNKEARVALLESWLRLEREVQANAALSHLAKPELPEAMMPRKVKARRMALGPDGQELGWEEYYDYHFPDDAKKVTGLKILENAMKWKAAAAAASSSSSSSSSSSAAGVSGPEDGPDAGAGACADFDGRVADKSLGKRKAAEIDIDDI